MNSLEISHHQQDTHVKEKGDTDLDIEMERLPAFCSDRVGLVWYENRWMELSLKYIYNKWLNIISLFMSVHSLSIAKFSADRSNSWHIMKPWPPTSIWPDSHSSASSVTLAYPLIGGSSIGNSLSSLLRYRERNSSKPCCWSSYTH